MIWKKLGQGITKGTAKVVNTVDDAVDTVKNTIYNITERAKETGESIKSTYTSTRRESAKIQREIEEGIRDVNGRRKPKEALNSSRTNEAASEAITNGIEITKNEARGRWSWKDDDGNFYYRRTKTEVVLDSEGNPVRKKSKNNGKDSIEYFKKTPDGKVQITGEEYGTARQAWIDSLPDEVAENISKTETLEHSGLGSFWNWVEENPLPTAGIALGSGIVISELLDDD